ncbi:MAG: hydrogenase maturation nickel metallochaperone HypA [Planctomycetota bacterium]|nr:MAG: hydrogenase maturation nickel metallochaperone HypA [Planctomycetota bacterium]
MHELSIATTIVDEVCRHAATSGGSRVTAVTLRIGRLSGVCADPLRFCFEAASQGTPLDGARLEIIDVPVRIWCSTCSLESELPSLQRFACPHCSRPCGDIRAGRELDLESIEMEAVAPASIDPDSSMPALDIASNLPPPP